MSQGDLEKTQEKEIKLSLSFKTQNFDEPCFDYSLGNVYNVNHDLEDEKLFYCRTKYQNNIFTYTDQKEIRDCDILFFARKSKNKYYELSWPITKFKIADTYNIENLNNKMWLIQNTENNDKLIYEIENSPYYLQKNDIIKLGKIKYEIIKLKIISKENKPTNNLINNKIEKFGSIFIEKEINIKEDILDVKKKEKTKSNINDDSKCSSSKCPSSECTKENPLIKICNCDTYIHVNCLKKFLKNRMDMSENQDKTVISYKFENFGCEVCHEPYPLNFKIDYKGNNIACCLIDDLDPPENTNYMILESLTYIKNGKNIKYIFVIKLINSEITIGSKKENDIIIDRPSISRYHAVLKYDEKNGRISIINKGKYGTSILIKKNVKLNIGEKIYLQVGRTYIKAEVKEYSDEKKGEKEEEKKENTNSKRDDKKEKNYESTSFETIEMKFKDNQKK